MATRKSSSTFSQAIHAVAKAADLSSRELIDQINAWELGWDAGSHMKKLSEEQIQEVEKRLKLQLLEKLKGSSQKRESKKTAPKAAPKLDKPAAKTTTSKDKAEGKTKKNEPQKSVKTSSESVAEPDTQTDDSSAPTPAQETKTDKSKTSPKEDKRHHDKKREQEPSQADAQAPALTEDDIVDRIKTTLPQWLSPMGFEHTRISVSFSQNAIQVDLAGRGVGDILGQRNASARTDILEALQLLLQKAVFGAAHRQNPSIVIDVLGFREGRAQELNALAQRLAAYVQKTGKVLRVSAMNFIDRRAVHQSLSDMPEVGTESVGYGTKRALEISKAQPRKNHKDQESSSRSRDDDAHNPSAENDADESQKDARQHDDKSKGRSRNHRKNQHDKRSADNAQSDATSPPSTDAQRAEADNTSDKNHQDETPAKSTPKRGRPKKSQDGQPNGSDKKDKRQPSEADAKPAKSENTKRTSFKKDDDKVVSEASEQAPASDKADKTSQKRQPKPAKDKANATPDDAAPKADVKETKDAKPKKPRAPRKPKDDASKTSE